MSAIAIQSSGSGAGTLSITAPITATNRTLTLPDGTGTFAVNGVSTNIVSGTVVASTSGTSIDFTSIPSWVKRITVMFSGVSTSGTSVVQIQIGAGSVTTTGYLGSGGDIVGAAAANYTTGFGTQSAGNANHVRWGSVCIKNFSGNSWVADGVIALSNSGQVFSTGGGITLGGTLDRVRITTVNGTDTFDAGSINILYE